MAAEMQALAMQLSTAMCAKSGSAVLAEWSAVAAEAWACIEAETLVAKASPLSPPPPPEPRRLPLDYVANQCTVRSHLQISTCIFKSARITRVSGVEPTERCAAGNCVARNYY